MPVDISQAAPHRLGHSIAGVKVVEVETPHGLAKAHLHPAPKPRAAMVLGHGAGGGVESRDLVTATEVGLEQGVTVALVVQPYRVAGRRSPAPANQLDTAWTTVVEHLMAHQLKGLTLISGGRSLGARVACRTAEALNATAVLCLAFPLQPPGGRPSRLPELDGVTVPVLVVQGRRDHFGMPPAAPARTIAQVDADHALRTDLSAVGAAIVEWLRSLA
jgi:predicted alpha/beta-hydrolase family hydrolase